MQDIDPSLSKVLNVLGIKKYNPLQKLAVEKGFFTTNEDFVVIAKSRSGKSFLAALLAANEIFKIKQTNLNQEPKLKEEKVILAIIITPFHAAARDLYSLVSRWFGWFLKPFIMIGEAREAQLIFYFLRQAFLF